MPRFPKVISTLTLHPGGVGIQSLPENSRTLSALFLFGSTKISIEVVYETSSVAPVSGPQSDHVLISGGTGQQTPD